MPVLRARFRDDRDRPVPIFNPAGTQAAGDPHLAELSRRLVASTSVRLFSTLRPEHIPGIAGGLGAVAIIIASSIVAPAAPRWAVWLVAGFWAGAAALLDWRLALRTHRDHIARTLLGEARCASCGYPLDPARPEPDGCIVCPECAAAWLAARLDTPRPSHPRSGATPRANRLAAWADWPVITDAHDRAVRLADPRLPPELIGQRLTPNRAAAARQRLLAHVRPLRLGYLGVGIGFFLPVIVGLLGLAWASAGVGSLLWLACGLAVVWMGLVHGWRLLTGRAQSLADQTKEAFLLQGLCPACAADLRTIPATPDHIVTCPDCAAAWAMGAGPTPSTQRATTPSAALPVTARGPRP